ncbi:MAG: hypothetical protein JWP45_2515 [Mucilaginibacter sp.]|nr:hypothetical protein [Mucilaginibacter sp.]
MFFDLFEIFALMAVIILPFFLGGRKKEKTIRIPKNHNDTSRSRYAVNEHGFLEEIRQDKLSKHVQ